MMRFDCTECEVLKRVEFYVRVLGVSNECDWRVDAEIDHRIQPGWRAWRIVSGVLCDKKVQGRVTSKVYKTIVRPVLLDTCEAWPVNRAQDKKLEVPEIKTLRWSCDCTKLDKIIG